MADGDYYARNHAPGWRKVGSTIAGGQPFETVVDLATKAFAETMRVARGVPGVNALAGAFGSAPGREWFMATAEMVCRDGRHHLHTEVAMLAGVEAMESAGERLSGLGADDRRAFFAEAAARRIAEMHLHKCVGAEVPEAFASTGELRAFQEAVLDAMPMTELAVRMLEHEDGEGFHKPRRSRSPKGTEQMMDVRLDGPA